MYLKILKIMEALYIFFLIKLSQNWIKIFQYTYITVKFEIL